METHQLSLSQYLHLDEVNGLIRRLELTSTLLRRREEEQIVSIVPLPSGWLEESYASLLLDTPRDKFLQSRGWTDADLALNAARPEALRLFAEQRFGPGLEELFLASRGSYDQVIYSLIRTRDPNLCRELWFRITEDEAHFAELAHTFGEGPESSRNGMIGPIPIGKLVPPHLADSLRRLSPGEVSQPLQMGEWTVLLRLDHLAPARFDATMRASMLEECLNSFLDERVARLLAGQHLEPLTYYHAS
jgi:hypothetical protein